MKKAFAILLSVITVISTAFLSSCNKETVDDITISIDYVESTTFVSKEISNNNLSLEETSITSNKSQNDIGGGELNVQKYRLNYYDVPAPFADLVDSEEFEKWNDEIAGENPNITNEMVMKKFVQRFNISREDFDRANLECARIFRDRLNRNPVLYPLDYANQEACEIYNADIIYSFDDEIINEYYLTPDYAFTYEDEFEKAVKNGEYVVRTLIWVDVDQMETEFIEKYGYSPFDTVAESATETTTEALTSIE